jgi:hypothetical protein
MQGVGSTGRHGTGKGDGQSRVEPPDASWSWGSAAVPGGTGAAWNPPPAARDRCPDEGGYFVYWLMVLRS